MSLSVCLLTRNEEKKIARALQSVAPVADEVIVVDTGSTDRTLQIAGDLQAKVFEFRWDDDFAAAQNFALDRATADWVLWLNPDEELLPSSGPHIAPCLANAEAFGYWVFRRDQVLPDRADYFSEVLDLRLFRRHEDVRYVGRTQPQFLLSLEEIARREGQKLFRCPITLCRHGYESPLTEAKLRWATRLLELELRDRPGQLHYLIEFGRNLLFLKDPHGHEVLAQATEKMLESKDAPGPPSPTVGRVLEYLLAHPTDKAPVSLSSELAGRWFPDSPPLLWAQAELAFARGDYADAVQLLEKLLLLGQTGDYDKTQHFDPSIIGAAALRNLSACFRRLLVLDRADFCYSSLLNHEAYRAQAESQLRDIQVLRRQTPQTLELLQDIDRWEKQGTDEARRALQAAARQSPPIVSHEAKAALERLQRAGDT